MESPEPLPLTAAAQPPSGRFLAVLLLILALGAALRLVPVPAFQAVGFDEALYRDYAVKLDRVGLAGYPDICALYLEQQQRPEAGAKLPPTRFLYVGCATLWKNLFHRNTPMADPRQPGFAGRDPYLISLKSVSTLFSLLQLALLPLCVWRMLGPGPVIPATALLACAPVPIHMAQHALIDGFFGFWAMLALWLLWESLQRPLPGRLLALGASCAALVLAKENAFFVGAGLGLLLLLANRAGFGKPGKHVWLACGAGTLLGVSSLALLAGGFEAVLAVYKLLVTQASVLPYAIQTGDGPWHRYLLDLLTVNPVLFCFAMAATLGNGWRVPATAYLLAFVGATYLVMCNVRYGMNLRYTTLWDFPLCILAATQIRHWAGTFPGRAVLLENAVLGAACLSALHLYHVLFIQHPLYELASRGLLEALKILK